MNYECRDIKRMIESYENSGNITELIGELKRHINDFGRYYAIVSISKEDLEDRGYNTTDVSDETIEAIASKIEMRSSLDEEIYYWADEYEIPKRDR